MLLRVYNVQITNEVNGRGETFSIDMIGRPTANQLEGFEFDEDKMLWYENAHDHVNDLIQELDDCEIGEGWRWQPLSKRCVCHGGPLAVVHALNGTRDESMKPVVFVKTKSSRLCCRQL